MFLTVISKFFILLTIGWNLQISIPSTGFITARSSEVSAPSGIAVLDGAWCF